jgi:CHAT domain-containing protein/tetratricopeptide (TPR) repeat protein
MAAEASADMKQVLQIDLEVNGRNHVQTADTFYELSFFQFAAGDTAGARQSAHEALTITKAIYDDRSWQVTAAKLHLKNIEHATNIAERQRLAVLEALQQRRRAIHLHAQENSAAAHKCAEQAYSILKEILGVEHLWTASAADTFAFLCTVRGDLKRATGLLEQEAAVYRKYFDETHPRYAYCLGWIGGLYGRSGDLALALPKVQEALRVQRKVLGADSSECQATTALLLQILDRLSSHKLNAGDFRTAEILLREYAALQRQIHGEGSLPDIAAQMVLTRFRTVSSDTPKLRPFEFLDHFQKNHAAWYDLSESVQWENGAVRLTNGSTLGRTVCCGPGVVLAVEMTNAASSSQIGDAAEAAVEFGFPQRPGIDVLLSFSAGREQEVRIVVKERKPPGIAGLLAKPKQLRETVVKGCRPEGAWTFRLWHGLVEVEKDGRRLASVFDFDSNPIDVVQSVRWRQIRGSLRCSLWRLSLLPPPPFFMRDDQAQAQKEMNDFVAAKLAIDGERYGEARTALERFEQAVSRREGPESPVIATVLALRGLALTHNNEWRAAEECLKKAVVLNEQIFGPRHPYTAIARGHLGHLLVKTRDFDSAGRELQAAAALMRAALARPHEGLANVLGWQGDLFRELASYDEARQSYEQALGIIKQRYGPGHPRVAELCGRLALLARDVGDYSSAHTMLAKALEIADNARESSRPLKANILQNFSIVSGDCGDTKQALLYSEKSLDVLVQHWGKQHPTLIVPHNNAAMLCLAAGDFPRARVHINSAREVARTAHGEEHPIVALLEFNQGNILLGESLYAKGQTATENTKPAEGISPSEADDLIRGAKQAKPHLERALAVQRKTLGTGHRETIMTLYSLGAVHHLLGDRDQTTRYVREGFEADTRLTELILPVLSEAELLAHMEQYRDFRDGAFGVMTEGASARELLEMIWRTQAQVTRCLIRRRQEVQRVPTKAQDTLNRLADTRRRLAQLAMSASKELSLDIGPELDRLSKEKELLERELARIAPTSRNESSFDASEVDACLKELPSSTAVIVLKVGSRADLRRNAAGHFVRSAFYEGVVVKRTGTSDPITVQRIEAMPAEPIDQAILAFRKDILAQVPGQSGPASRVWEEERSDSARAIRALIWKRLEPLVAGCSTIVVVPDGVVTQLPWGALPGGNAKTFLVEEIGIVTVPSLSQLAVLFSVPPPKGDGLLLVGDVNYDKVASVSSAFPTARRGTALMPADPLTWQPLPATIKEIQQIASLRGHTKGITILSGAQANTAAVMQELPRARFAHLATHGFFAPETFRWPRGETNTTTSRIRAAGWPGAPSTILVRNPLTLSGIVLAGANTPPVPDGISSRSAYDAVVTAENLVNLNLVNTELVTLSACDTGLGITTRGEGVFGLQRALQLAGVRTTVASLWSVDDSATQALMVEFYHNLWTRKLTKLESLRQAQLTIMRSYDPASGRLRGPGQRRPGDPEAIERARAEPSTQGRPLPPFYWASFVISGDWR